MFYFRRQCINLKTFFKKVMEVLEIRPLWLQFFIWCCKRLAKKYAINIHLLDLPVSVYYAGNYEYMRPKYKQDYDEFFKELNASIDEYQYFIKTDITNFFSNINIDKLVAQIDQVCNSDEISFSQTQLHLFKELLVTVQPRLSSFVRKSLSF